MENFVKLGWKNEELAEDDDELMKMMNLREREREREEFV